MSWWSDIKEAAAKVVEAAKKKLEEAKALAIATAKALADKAAAAAKAVIDAAKKIADATANALEAKKAAETEAKKKAIELAEEVAKAAANKVAEAAKKVADALAESKRIIDEKKEQAEVELEAAEAKQKEIEEAETSEEIKIPWYTKWFGWSKEQIEQAIWANPVADLFALAHVIDNLLPEKWKGEKEKAPSWVYEMGLWIFFAPAMATGVEALIKAGATKPEAEGVMGALKDGMKFDELMLMIREDPAKYAELMKLMTTGEKSMIMAALKKQADPTAYRLAAEALEAAAKSEGVTAIQKVLGVLPGKTTGTKLFISISALVGLIGSYVTAATFYAWTGKEALKEAISFSGIYLFIDNKEWQAAKDHLPELKTAIEAYDYSRALTKVIPFVAKIYDVAIENAWKEYDYYEELIDMELAKVTEETEEEKWERIRLEQEEREKTDRIAEAEYYAKLQEEADKRKAAARIEEADYYEKLRIESEERAAARKIEEAEYWANVQEQARIAEEEKQISAEEYWAKVEADKIATREAEDAYWAAKLAGPNKATITITSIPTNSDVYIDGEFTFTKTPYTVLLAEGEYVMMVQKEGYYPLTYNVEIEAGETAEVPFELEEIPSEEITEEPYIPYQPVYEPGYENLYPAPYSVSEYEAPAPSEEKELLINVETTDVNPWEGKIYSIAFQDLSDPESLPNVLTDNNEEELIKKFLEIFNYFNPKKLIGFKLTFDHRFIFAKMMLYRIQNKAFKNIQMLDVKQIMDQVQEQFVYFPSKTGTLDDWGKMLLGKGKYGEQELMLKKYLEGDFDYVKAFQDRQLEITKGLYDLARFCGSESSSAPISSIYEMTSTETTPGSSITSQAPGQKQCSNCLAYNPIDSKVCVVCGQVF